MKQKKRIKLSISVIAVLIFAGFLTFLGIGADQNDLTAAPGDPAFVTIYGVNRDQIVAELSTHTGDNYYLGTPYNDSVSNTANGNGTHANSLESFFPHGRMADYGNTEGMAFGGFIKAVILKITNDTATADGVRLSDATNRLSRKMKQDIVSNGVLNTDYYQYNTIAQLLSGGKAKKGDIVYVLAGTDTLSNFGSYALNYPSNTGFFWGNTSSDNKYWLSDADPGVMKNQITTLKAKEGNTINGVVLIPTGAEPAPDPFDPEVKGLTTQYILPGANLTVSPEINSGANWPTGGLVEYCLSVYGPYQTAVSSPTPDVPKRHASEICKNMSPTSLQSFTFNNFTIPGYYYVGVSVDASPTGPNALLSSQMTGGFNKIKGTAFVKTRITGYPSSPVYYSGGIVNGQINTSATAMQSSVTTSDLQTNYWPKSGSSFEMFYGQLKIYSIDGILDDPSSPVGSSSANLPTGATLIETREIPLNNGPGNYNFNIAKTLSPGSYVVTFEITNSYNAPKAGVKEQLLSADFYSAPYRGFFDITDIGDPPLPPNTGEPQIILSPDSAVKINEGFGATAEVMIEENGEYELVFSAYGPQNADGTEVNCQTDSIYTGNPIIITTSGEYRSENITVDSTGNVYWRAELIDVATGETVALTDCDQAIATRVVAEEINYSNVPSPPLAGGFERSMAVVLATVGFAIIVGLLMRKNSKKT